MITVYLIRQQGSPYWYAQWVLKDAGKRKTKSLKTADPGEAEAKRAELERRLNLPGADPTEIGWGRFVERFVAERLGQGSAGAAANARRDLARFGKAQKVAGPAAVTASALSKHAADLRSAGLAAATIATHFAHLRTAMRWAVALGMAEKLPAFPKIKVPKKRVRTYLEAARLPELLARCPAPEWRLFCQVAWHTGMRCGELFLLRWDEGGGPWLDLAAERVRFPAEFTKGRADDWLPLHPALLPHLRAAQKERGRVFDLAPDARALSARFCALARGVCKTHDLRRGFGTRYAPLVPAHILQRLMRHAKIETTLEYYADLDPALEAAIRLA